MVLALMAAVLATSCSQKQQTARETVVNVKTVRVEAGSHVVGKSYMGKIVEEDGANVSFGVIGNVVRVMVEEGQFVKKGQAMAEVDGQNVRSAHEISAATLNQAEDAYRRLKNLYDKGTLPEIKMVEKSVLERKIAKANMLPVLAVGATASYSKFTSNSWNPRVMGFVGVQLPLSSFWSERHEYKRKMIEEQKANDFRQDKREMITLQIQDAYDNLTSTYQQTQIARKSIGRAEENMRISREHYQEGLTTMTAQLDAQRQQQQAFTQYNAAVSEYLQAKTKYLILTGRRQDAKQK